MKSNHRYVILLWLLLALLMTVAPPAQGLSFQELGIEATCYGCNIVLITLDTVRADHLECYGYDRETSPNICGLADGGYLFEHAYSPASSTIPALRAIFTGRVIANEGLEDIIAFHEGIPYLGEIMKEAGYKTAAFSDHYGVGEDLVRGFDTFENVGIDRASVTSEKLSGAAMEWIKREGGEKFFLWLHYFDPHFNFNPLPEHEDTFGFPATGCGRVYNGIDIEEIRRIESDLTAEEIACLVSFYDSELHYTDRSIGKVLESLKTLGLEGGTIVIVTADHGEEFGERSRVGHEMTLYNEVVHVPLIIRLPSRGMGARIVENISTRTTFHFVVSLGLGRDIPVEEVTVSRTNHYYRDGKTSPNDFALVEEPFKIIVNPTTGEEEFYNLDKDPGERNSPLWSPRHGRLARKLKKWIADNTIDLGAPSAEALEDTKELNDRLRSLGYIR